MEGKLQLRYRVWLIGLRNKNDEPNYTYNHEYTRHFFRQSVNSGRCVALNQHYKSFISGKVFEIISEELNVNGNVCEIVDKYFEYTNKHRKIIENEYDAQLKDYRDVDEEDRTKHI